jgi:TRAP-type uncharacterized transport system fused permease subunit
LWTTGWAALRIAATSFIVPFMFVYAPELLMIGEWPDIVWASLSATVGVLMFSAGLHGYFLTHSAHWQSALLIVGGLLLIDPHFSTDVIGALLAGIVVATQLASRRAQSKIPRHEIAAE